MNRTQKILVGGGVLAFVANYFFTAYKKLRFGVKNWSIVSFSQNSIVAKIALYVTNPTFIALKIGNLKADILLDKTKIGTINYPINRELQAHGTSIFTVSVELLYTEAASELWSVLSDATAPLITEMYITISGTIDVQNRAVKIEKLIPVKNLLKQS